MPEAADQPAEPGLPGRSLDDCGAKPGRSLTGFYIGLGIVAALVGLGVVLYPHLRLQYAIRQVRSATRGDDRGAGEWVDLVSEAARSGNGNAIDALIMYQKQGLCGPLWLWMVATGPAEGRAMLYRRLDRWPDKDVIIPLAGLADYIGTDWSKSEESGDYRYDDWLWDPRGIVVNMEPVAEQAQEPRVREVAQDLLAFTRRRFASLFTEKKAVEDFGSSAVLVRYSVLRWLSHVRAEDDVLAPVLVRALADSSWHIRGYAAVALSDPKWKRTPEIVPALIKALNIPETLDQSQLVPLPAARTAACKALGVLEDSRAIGPLESLAQTGDPMLRSAAAEALEKIRGRETPK